MRSESAHRTGIRIATAVALSTLGTAAWAQSNPRPPVVDGPKGDPGGPSPKPGRGFVVRGDASAVATAKGWGANVGEAISLLQVTRASTVTFAFSDWGNPVREGSKADAADIPMSVRFEIPSIGFAYEGPASGLNGVAVPVPLLTGKGTTPTFDFRIVRRIRVEAGTSAGEYRNAGRITISGV